MSTPNAERAIHFARALALSALGACASSQPAKPEAAPAPTTTAAAEPTAAPTVPTASASTAPSVEPPMAPAVGPLPPPDLPC